MVIHNAQPTQLLSERQFYTDTVNVCGAIRCVIVHVPAVVLENIALIFNFSFCIQFRMDVFMCVKNKVVRKF